MSISQTDSQSGSHRIKLSEAIRLGSMLGPQCYGKYMRPGIKENATCAMGAAMMALGLSFVDMSEVFPQLPQTVIHPVSGKECWLRNTIVSLNDSYRWTREAIADWVATVEEAPVAVAEAVAAYA